MDADNGWIVPKPAEEFRIGDQGEHGRKVHALQIEILRGRRCGQPALRCESPPENLVLDLTNSVGARLVRRRRVAGRC